MNEHISCLRYSPKETENIKRVMSSRLQELVPERFQYQGLPTFFQFVDPERIRSIILDKKRDLLSVEEEKDALFAVTCKIFRYLNRMVSVRILISKFTEIPVEEEDSDVEGDNKTKAKTKTRRDVAGTQYSHSVNNG